MTVRKRSTIFILLLSLCPVGLVISCGPSKKARSFTPVIERIFQDFSGNVNVEIGNLHDYLTDKDAGRSMEISIGKEWYLGSFLEESKQNPGNGIYTILYPTSSENKITSYSTLPFISEETQSVQPKEVIAITARTRENYYYKASPSSLAKTYKLKSKLQTQLDLAFRYHRGNVLSSDYSYQSKTQEEDELVFYFDIYNPMDVKLGILTTEEIEDGYLFNIKALSTEEQIRVSLLNLEYKVKPFDDEYLIESSSERYINTYFHSLEDKLGPSTDGWSSSLILKQEDLWTFMGTIEEEVKYFVFMVRQKANEDVVQSQAIPFVYLYDRRTIE